MRKKSFSLMTGLKVGEAMALDAEIREGTYGDQLDATEAGFKPGRVDLEMAMRRVVRIGSLQSPSKEMLRMLTSADWVLIERAQRDMDREILAEMKEAGLLEDPHEGRDQPGDPSPGHS